MTRAVTVRTIPTDYKSIGSISKNAYLIYLNLTKLLPVFTIMLVYPITWAMLSCYLLVHICYVALSQVSVG